MCLKFPIYYKKPIMCHSLIKWTYNQQNNVHRIEVNDRVIFRISSSGCPFILRGQPPSLKFQSQAPFYDFCQWLTSKIGPLIALNYNTDFRVVSIVTFHNSSCGKVMFLQASVIPCTGEGVHSPGRYLLTRPPLGRQPLLGRPPHLGRHPHTPRWPLKQMVHILLE